MPSPPIANSYDGTKLEPDIAQLLGHHTEEEPIESVHRSDIPSAQRSEDGDIQVIQRDTPSMFDLPYDGAGKFNNNTKYPDFAEDSFLNMVPSHSMALTSGAPKFLTPLPPLHPLSESAIPNSIALRMRKPTLENGAASVPVQKKKKEPSGPKARPAFVMKIWSMVNDKANDEYIRWNEDGKTFQVFHREEFMRNILPKYFKHNNFASFVRQLNMYGWHKVQDINSGTMQMSGGTNGLRESEEIWQFENPNFMKDREDLLDKIVRNKSVNQEGNSTGFGGTTSGVSQIMGANGPDESHFQLMLNELDQIKMNQLALTEDLRRIRTDNKTLWSENYVARERNQHQAQTLDKILKFLAAVYGNQAGKILEMDSGADSALTTYNYQNQNQQQQYQNDYSQNTHGQNPQQNQQMPLSSPQSPGGAFMPPNFQKRRLMLTNGSPNGSSNSNNVNHNNSSNSLSSQANPETGGSIEEIIRSYENTPTGVNNNSNYNNNSNNGAYANTPNKPGDVKRFYQQFINQDVASPRHFFPELNMGNVPNSPGYFPPASPGQSFIPQQNPGQQVPPPLSPTQNPDFIQGLEQNILKQGQSIQQVQDWISKLASQQQQQQSVIDEIQDTGASELDGFDMSEFLDSKTPQSAGTPINTTDSPPEEINNKRSLEDFGLEEPNKRRA